VRILQVVPSYLPAWRFGGPIRSVHGLSRALVKAGHRVTVATTDADGAGRLAVPLAQPVERDGVAVRYFPRAFPSRLYRSPRLGAWVRREVEGFDLVHLHSVFLDPTAVAARAAENAGVPYVLSPRGMLVPELFDLRGALRKRLWIELVERRTLSRAAAIHVTSGVEASDLQRCGLALAPVVEIPNGVELAVDEESRSAEDAARVSAAIGKGSYVLCLGRIAAKKRLDLAVRAVAGVDSLRLVIAGNDEDGLAARLLAEARRQGAAERVELLGEIRGAAKQELLENSLALLLPSSSENFGNVVVESLAARRPVLVSRGVGAAEIVLRADAGWVVDDGDAAWVAALQELLRNPANATAKGSRGRDWVERELTWERIADRMSIVYEEIVARRRPGRG
jgi:glycosyltransferase involved in cell wall biosynthesis